MICSTGLDNCLNQDLYDLRIAASFLVFRYFTKCYYICENIKAMLRLNHFRKQTSMWPMGAQRKGYASAILFSSPL